MGLKISAHTGPKSGRAPPFSLAFSVAGWYTVFVDSCMLCIPSASPRTGCLLCGAFSFVNVHFLKVPVLFMWASHRYRGRTKLRRVIVGTECRNRGFIEERQFKKSSLDIARRKMRRHPRRALVCVIQSRNRRVVYIHEVVRNPPPVPQCAPT